MTDASPLAVAQTQLDAYNAQDLEKFLACYAEDVHVERDDGTPSFSGKAEMRTRYAAIFANYPRNQALLLGRVHVGPWVFDSEMVVGRGPDPFYVVARYLVKDGLITSVAFFTQQPAL